MNGRRRALRNALVHAAVVGVISTGVALAAATKAENDAFTFSGWLLDGENRPVGGPHEVQFSFTQSGRACSAKPTTVDVDPVTGVFVARVESDSCESSFFDGTDTTFAISVDNVPVVADRPLSPVPYAQAAEHTGHALCPLGFERNADAREFTVCRRGRDEVVRVGTGASAFWIDRYEASVWSGPDGIGQQVSPGADRYPLDLPRNGQGTASYYAASVAGVAPNAFGTWFQATALCRASGKRLPRPDEWLAAARGTKDPAAPSAGEFGSCNTQSGAVRSAGAGTACVSAWGAEDMVGNLWEWTTKWLAGLSSGDVNASFPWPAGYNDDAVLHVVSRTQNGESVVEAPAAELRGGDHEQGTLSGVFAVQLEHAPSSFTKSIGFRCVVDR
jgi:formylglycine-generating enzyme required for sulfatase activity